MSTYAFRFLRSTWGIAIDLTAELRAAPSAPAGAAEIAPRVALELDPDLRLPESDLHHLRAGLARMAPALRRSAGDGVAVVHIHEVGYNPTDYQTEGMEAAAIGWAAEALGIDPPPVTIEFDKPANRYRFTYPEPDPDGARPGTPGQIER